MSEPNTKNKIMDASERLFAQNGYHRTSLREITASAGANLAAVNYHFGSKENLFEAILQRRISPLNQIREERMRQVIETAKTKNCLPDVEKLLRAFVEPTLELIGNTPGSLDFFIIVNRCTMEPNGAQKNCFIKLMQPTLMKFYYPLCESLPHLSKEFVFMRFMFTIGSMVNTIRMLNMMDQIAEKDMVIPENIDISIINEELIKFITSGMENA
ncbi:MAG: TetR/AcrR family transcriptional regulator [Desulfobacterium sp.]